MIHRTFVPRRYSSSGQFFSLSPDDEEKKEKKCLLKVWALKKAVAKSLAPPSSLSLSLSLPFHERGAALNAFKSEWRYLATYHANRSGPL